jgi:uncharacterized protein YlxP (DUF503 family)
MSITIGVCTFTLRLPENGSLKGKRQVIRSLQQRLHNKFNLSVAEVEHNDTWQLAGMAACCVSNSSAHANEVLSKALDFVHSMRLDAEVVEEEIELIQG